MSGLGANGCDGLEGVFDMVEDVTLAGFATGASRTEIVAMLKGFPPVILDFHSMGCEMCADACCCRSGSSSEKKVPPQ